MESVGRPMINDVTKVIMYRVLSLIATLVISCTFFGKARSTLEFTVLLMTVLTILHYTFEKVWKKIELRGHDERRRSSSIDSL